VSAFAAGQWAERDSRGTHLLGERAPLLGIGQLVLLEHARRAIVARLPHLVPRARRAQRGLPTTLLDLIVLEVTLEEQRAERLAVGVGAESEQTLVLVQQFRKVLACNQGEPHT